VRKTILYAEKMKNGAWNEISLIQIPDCKLQSAA